MPPVAPLIMSLGSALTSGLVQSAFNRSDYRFTHNMTNAPAQVAELKQAGLNPALAYGQISASQGQSLGNYQQDISQIGKTLSQIPLIKQQEATGKAEENYYNALAFKTQQDGLIAQFNQLHQQDLFDLDYEFYGLRNRQYQLGNYNLSLKNDWQRIENGIRRIDWSAHNQVIEVDLQKTFSQIVLFGSQANAINRKLPYEISQLAAGTKELLTRAKLNMENVLVGSSIIGKNNAEANYFKMNRDYIMSLKEGQDLVNGYENFLTDHGTDFQGKTNHDIYMMIIDALAGMVPHIGFYGKLGGNSKPGSVRGFQTH